MLLIKLPESVFSCAAALFNSLIFSASASANLAASSSLFCVFVMVNPFYMDWLRAIPVSSVIY